MNRKHITRVSTASLCPVPHTSINWTTYWNLLMFRFQHWCTWQTSYIYLPTSTLSCGHRRMEFEAKVSLEHSRNLQLPHIHQRSGTKTKLSWALKSHACIKHLKLVIAECSGDRKTHIWCSRKEEFSSLSFIVLLLWSIVSTK